MLLKSELGRLSLHGQRVLGPILEKKGFFEIETICLSLRGQNQWS